MSAARLSTDAKIDLMQRIGEVNFIYASTNYLHTLTEAMLPPRRWSRNARFRTLRTLFIAAEGYPLEWARAHRGAVGLPPAGRLRQYAMRRFRCFDMRRRRAVADRRPRLDAFV